jgi:hypothetical protein
MSFTAWPNTSSGEKVVFNLIAFREKQEQQVLAYWKYLSLVLGNRKDLLVNSATNVFQIACSTTWTDI